MATLLLKEHSHTHKDMYFTSLCALSQKQKRAKLLKYTVYPQSCIIRNITNYRDFIVFTALAVHIGSRSLKCSQSADNSSALSPNWISENFTSIISCCVNFNLCKLTTPHHRMCVGKEKKKARHWKTICIVVFAHNSKVPVANQ